MVKLIIKSLKSRECFQLQYKTTFGSGKVSFKVFFQQSTSQRSNFVISQNEYLLFHYSQMLPKQLLNAAYGKWKKRTV